MTEMLENFDFSLLEEEDFAVGKKTNSFEKISYVGGKGTTWPVDVRILVNMSSKDEARPYHENHIHEHIVNDNYVRIPCARSIGQKCAICDAHWEHKNESEKLEARGAKSESNPLHGEWRKHTALMKLYKQKQRFSMLVAVRNDNKISVLDAKPQLTKAIFGDKFKGAVGAIDELKRYGVSIFNPNEKTGWLTLNKTGQGLATSYTAKPALHTKINGRKKEEELVEEPLHPLILEKFKDMTKLIALNKMIKDRMWSEEEVQAYVDSSGTVIPSRISDFFKKKDKNASTASNTQASTPSESVDFDSMDEDFNPF